jgi:hypothetical protein
VAPGVFGATIAGGGATNFSGSTYTNKVTANFATVVGGLDNTASGEYSTAMGLGTTASGRASVAMGQFSVASDGYSTAMGGGTTASGAYSTAMGVSSDASGPISTAMGEYTTASGRASTAMGAVTTASGDYSTAMGRFAKANHDGSFVWADFQDGNFASTAENQFSIRAANGMRIQNRGNGAPLLVFDTERSWVFRQLNTGASTALELGTVDASNPKPFIIQANAVGIGTASPTHLLHVNGVARSTQSSWATSSDARAKRDIATLESSLERIARLRPVSFEYTEEYADGRKGYEGRFTGFVAQEVESVFPEMVETVHEKIGDKEVEDFRVLNAGGLTPHLVAAVQELSHKVDSASRKSEDGTRSLEVRLQQKEAEITELKQRLAALEKLMRNQKSN